MYDSYLEYLRKVENSLSRNGIHLGVDLSVDKDTIYEQVSIFEMFFSVNNMLSISGSVNVYRGIYTQNSLSYMRQGIFEEYQNIWNEELKGLTVQPDNAGEIEKEVKQLNLEEIEKFTEGVGLVSSTNGGFDSTNQYEFNINDGVNTIEPTSEQIEGVGPYSSGKQGLELDDDDDDEYAYENGVLEFEYEDEDSEDSEDSEGMEFEYDYEEEDSDSEEGMEFEYEYEEEDSEDSEGMEFEYEEEDSEEDMDFEYEEDSEEGMDFEYEYEEEEEDSDDFEYDYEEEDEDSEEDIDFEYEEEEEEEDSNDSDYDYDYEEEEEEDEEDSDDFEYDYEEEEEEDSEDSDDFEYDYEEEDSEDSDYGYEEEEEDSDEDDVSISDFMHKESPSLVKGSTTNETHTKVKNLHQQPDAMADALVNKVNKLYGIGRKYFYGGHSNEVEDK